MQLICYEKMSRDNLADPYPPHVIFGVTVTYPPPKNVTYYLKNALSEI